MKQVSGASAETETGFRADASSRESVSTEGFNPARDTVASELARMDAERAVVPVENGILNVIAKAAADPNTDVDKLERLLAMQERVLARDAEQAFNEALRAAQDEILPIVRNKTNSSTSSKYADLERVSDCIDPVFRRHGFSSSFGTADCPMDGHYRVTCRLSHTGGHSRDYQADVPADTAGIKGNQNKTATHGFGSALSYGRRYLKLLIADVATVDDDGRAAAKGGPINGEQLRVINGLCDAVSADKAAFCRYLKIDALPQLSALDYDNAIHVLKQKNQDAAREYLTGGK
jgi:hypothetical protein